MYRKVINITKTNTEINHKDKKKHTKTNNRKIRLQ